MNSSRIRVKMCGMTRHVDIAHAVDLGVDAIGLIFYPKSSRCITVEHAKSLLRDLPPFVDAVAVLVNPDRDFVLKIINELPVSLLQFHGEEASEFCQEFGKPYIKATHPETSEHIEEVAGEYTKAKAILLDSASETSKGGTGLVFDWRIIPKTVSKPYILAGGLNEFNVVDAVNTCAPYAVDVCSGIEVLPGIKDHQKMNRFMTALWGNE